MTRYRFEEELERLVRGSCDQQLQGRHGACRQHAEPQLGPSEQPTWLWDCPRQQLAVLAAAPVKGSWAAGAAERETEKTETAKPSAGGRRTCLGTCWQHLERNVPWSGGKQGVAWVVSQLREDFTAGLPGAPPPRWPRPPLFPYTSPVCLHPSFVVLGSLFHKTRITLCSVGITPLVGQGLLDVTMSNNDSGDGNEHCSSPSIIFSAWRLQVDSETEFVAQIQARGCADNGMGRVVHDSAVPWTLVSGDWWFLTVRRQRK